MINITIKEFLVAKYDPLFVWQVVFACVSVALCAAQNVDPKKAKILKEQRFNAGDGRAGSAFATEDGTIFKEEADADGNRIGQVIYFLISFK